MFSLRLLRRGQRSKFVWGDRTEVLYGPEHAATTHFIFLVTASGGRARRLVTLLPLSIPANALRECSRRFPWRCVPYWVQLPPRHALRRSSERRSEALGYPACHPIAWEDTRSCFCHAIRTYPDASLSAQPNLTSAHAGLLLLCAILIADQQRRRNPATLI